MLPFPPELYSLVFADLPTSDLANLSLCSHQFCILVFPLLYDRVTLVNDEEMTSFASRINARKSSVQTPTIYNLNPSEYVTTLCIGPDEGYYSYDTLQLLAAAIPHLLKLQKLVWIASTYEDPEIAKIFMLIRKHCTKFNSLSVKLDWGGDEEDEHMTSVLDFKGLRNLKLSTSQMGIWHNQLPSVMTDMVRSSPELVTLDLHMRTYGESGDRWDVDKFCENLGGTRYPSLRSLKLRGNASVDLERLCDISATPSPFRSFIELNHRNLTILTLPAPPEDFDWGPNDLHLPEDIFPNLCDFEGTVYWCFHISKLRYPGAQLRKMKVLIDRPLYDEDEERARSMVHAALKCCSRLTDLDILCEGTVVSAAHLAGLLKYAPGLQVLKCFIDIDESLDSISSALASFSALRSLIINLSNFQNDLSRTDAILKLSEHCPSLKGVEDFQEGEEDGPMFAGYEI